MPHAEPFGSEYAAEEWRRVCDPDPLTVTDEWADGYRCGQESRRRSGTIAALCVIGIAVLVLVVVGVTK